MKCANMKCDNDLTQWELERTKRTFSPVDLCRRCRWKKSSYNTDTMSLLRCRGCGLGFYQESYTKAYCDKCVKKRTKKTHQLYAKNNPDKIKINNHKQYNRRKEINKTRIINS